MVRQVKRGDVWWANLQTSAGQRPVLLLSRNSAYRVRTQVTVATITTTRRGIPVEVPLSPADGMRSDCVVNVDNIITIPKRQLLTRMTELSPERMDEVAVAIAYALDLPFGY